MAHYSKIDYSGDPVATFWNNIVLSPRTVQERNRLKWGIDDFASFTWRGIDAFETFGAFIVNNKNSLKFYNGPSFSNEYTKPQFETAAGQLTGVTFQIQKIDFTIGVYWISEEDYRQMIYWLHPYEINTLTFGFEPNYYYQVKLASVENGTRYIVGTEDNKPMYYTEMKISFELQGPPVAYGNTYFAFEQHTPDVGNWLNEKKNEITTYSIINRNYDERNSDLETPLIIETTIDFSKILKDITVTETGIDDLQISAFVKYNNQSDPIKLYEVIFKNLNFGEHSDSTSNKFNITYNSESALLFLQHGNSMRELLSRLTTLTSGDRIVDSLSVNQFRIPGNFDDYEFDLSKLSVEFKVTILNPQFSFTIPTNPASLDELKTYFTTSIYSRPRTNLI